MASWSMIANAYRWEDRSTFSRAAAMGQVAVVVVSGSFASRGKVFADMSRAKLAEEEGGRGLVVIES